MARVLVFGAGAVGAYFGAALQRGSRDVVFVARGAHLDAMQTSGIHITGAMGEFSLQPVEATDAPAGEFDVILVSVKNYDLDDAAAALRECGGVVLTLQNGVEAPYQMRSLVGDRVLAGTTGIVSDLPEPGHVHVVSAYAWIRFGEPDGGGLTDRVRRVAALLGVPGIDPTPEADVRVALWQKMALMCAMAGLTTLHQRPMGEILGDAALHQAFVDLVRECEAVARARGIDLPSDFSDERMQYAEAIDPGAMSSMSRDFARGRRIEVDTFNGAVVRMGAEASVPTPRNQAVYDAIRKGESGRALRG
jgi:2-dehydropantoate 2-reductase